MLNVRQSGSVEPSRGWPGSHLLFFALAKVEVSKRRGPPRGDRRLALRVPVCVLQKMGKVRNSLRSDNGPFLSIFCSTQTASSRAGVGQHQRQHQHQHQHQRHNQNQNQNLQHCRVAVLSLTLFFLLNCHRSGRSNLCVTENGSEMSAV